MFQRTTAWVRDEAGITLPIVAGGMVAVLAATALAIDIGMLAAARTEAQRVADAAALAGAQQYAFSNDETAARLKAIEYASYNLVRNDAAVVLPGDVDVDPAQGTVTVRVLRSRDRGTAVSTFFARVIGIDDAEVFADATAQATYASSINCLLPLTIPDRWQELGGDSLIYDDGIDNYTPWDPDNPSAPHTGYDAQSIGDTIRLRPFGGGGGEVNPSWYYPWRPPGQSGGDDYRTNIYSCVDPTIEYSVGMEADTEPGNMIGPTKQGFEDLIAQDPNARWDGSQDCIVTDGQQGDPTACRGSPRVRPVPFFDPRFPPDAGAKPFTFTNFGGLFVLGVQGNEILAVFLGYSGVDGGEGGTPGGAGPLFKRIVLIE